MMSLGLSFLADPRPTVDFMNSLAKGNAPMQRLLYSGKIIRFFEDFFGESIRHFDFTWVRTMGKGFGTDPHCDNVYMGRGSSRLCSMWVPYGDITYDMAFGGNFYALTPAADAGLVVDPSRNTELVEAGLAVMAAINSVDRPVHPGDARINGCHHVVFHEPGRDGADAVAQPEHAHVVLAEDALAIVDDQRRHLAAHGTSLPSLPGGSRKDSLSQSP